jgi:cobalt-zinc-cadmium efflux system outer membrane protein
MVWKWVVPTSWDESECALSRGNGSRESWDGRKLAVVALLSGAVSACGPAVGAAASPAGVESGVRSGARGDRAHLVDPRSVESVDLTALLAYADEHAPALVVARSRGALGDAALAEASPLLPENPQLQAQAGPHVDISGATDVDVSVTLTQRVSISGARGASLEAAERFKDLTEAEIEEVRWVVHCDVHTGYHAALVARERAKLAAQALAFQEDVLRIVKRQIAAGQSSPMSERLAEAEVAQARQQALAAEQAYLAARLDLAELSGWPAARPPVPEGTLDAPHEVPPLETLIAKAREHLPAFRTYTAAVREAEGRIDAEERRAWPEPTIGVQVFHEGGVAAPPPAFGVQGIVSVPLPVWQRNQGGIARARADAGVAAARKTSGETVLVAQIAKNHSAVVSASARVKSYGADVLPRFDENLKLVRRAFDLGEVDLLEVSVARDRFFRIQLDALGAHADYFVALAALERTVGVDLWADTHASEERR